MSLINDVLRDLQTRQAARAQPLAGLRPVAVSKRAPAMRWALVPVVALVLATTAWAAWRTVGGPARDAGFRGPALAESGSTRGLPVDAPAAQDPLITQARTTSHATNEAGVAVAGAQPVKPHKPRWATLADFARSLADQELLSAAQPGLKLHNRPGDPPGRRIRNASVRADQIAVRANLVTDAAAFEPIALEISSEIAQKAPRAENEGSLVVSRRSPNQPQAQRLRAALLSLQNGRLAEAEAALRAMTQDKPDFADAWIHLAQALVGQGRMAAAERTLYDALTQVEQSELVARALARHMLADQRIGAAIVVLESFRPASQDADHEAFLAALYQREGRHPEAAKIYRQLLGREPDRSAWWMGLAISEEGLGRTGAALAAYRRVGTTRPVEPLLREYASQRIAALGTQPVGLAQR